MSIVYYISAHGLGHTIRSAAIINKLPDEIPVIVRSEVSADLLAEEIKRPYTLAPSSFDTGAQHLDGFTVDESATFACFEDIHRSNGRRKAEEMAYLRGAGARVVVSDIASFPLAIAKEAGLKSLAVGNFTWGDIYEPFIAERPSYRNILEELRQEYAMADLGLKLPLSLAMNGLESLAALPLVCRKGTSIRPALAGWLDIDPEAPWALVYLGQYPVEFDWERLAAYPDWKFLYISKTPSTHPGVFAVDPSRFNVPDIFASCQVVIGKTGYGTAADCIAANVPIVYALPKNFAEGTALDEGLTRWGRGVKVELEELFKGDLMPAIEKAIATKVKHPLETDGAEVAAEFIGGEWEDAE